MGRCPGEQERALTPSLGLEVDVGTSHRSGQWVSGLWQVVSGRSRGDGRWWVEPGSKYLACIFKNILFCTGVYQLLITML